MSEKIQVMPRANYVLPASAVPDFSGAEVFGGGGGFLEIEIGDIAGPFKHNRIDKDVVLSDEFAPTDVFVATVGDSSEELRMPAGAIFTGAAVKAKLAAGDVYYVKRLPDILGKKGKAKGKTMGAYQIAVTSRNPKATKDERAEAEAYAEAYQKDDDKPTRKRR